MMRRIAGPAVRLGPSLRSGADGCGTMSQIVPVSGCSGVRIDFEKRGIGETDLRGDLDPPNAALWKLRPGYGLPLTRCERAVLIDEAMSVGRPAVVPAPGRPRAFRDHRTNAKYKLGAGTMRGALLIAVRSQMLKAEALTQELDSSSVDSLSDFELAVFCRLACGWNQLEIADALARSEKQIRSCKCDVLAKLGVVSCTALTLLLIRWRLDHRC